MGLFLYFRPEGLIFLAGIIADVVVGGVTFCCPTKKLCNRLNNFDEQFFRSIKLWVFYMLQPIAYLNKHNNLACCAETF